MLCTQLCTQHYLENIFFIRKVFSKITIINGLIKRWDLSIRNTNDFCDDEFKSLICKQSFKQWFSCILLPESWDTKMYRNKTGTFQCIQPHTYDSCFSSLSHYCKAFWWKKVLWFVLLFDKTMGSLVAQSLMLQPLVYLWELVHDTNGFLSLMIWMLCADQLTLEVSISLKPAVQSNLYQSNGHVVELLVQVLCWPELEGQSPLTLA